MIIILNKIMEYFCQDPGNLVTSLVTIYGSERKLWQKGNIANEKDIHPEYRSVVFMDTTTQYKFSGSTKYSAETKLNLKVKSSSLIRVRGSSDLPPIYTGRQRFTQQMDVDKLNKNTVSGQHPTQKPLPFGSGFF